MQQFLAHYIEELLIGHDGLVRAIAELAPDELHSRPSEAANSIGFDAWHVFRTADNVVHFVCLGELPVWRQQGLDAVWGLPRNAQGTGMDPTEAHALRFPEAEVLARYGRDVATAIVPRVAKMTDELLEGVVTVAPHGELTRLRAIGTTILTHGNVHLGQIDVARTLLGKASLRF